MNCDIIVPVYNNAATLRRTAAALFNQAVPSTVAPRLIVSDDGSTDETADIARKLTPPPSWRPVVVIQNPHGGAAAARNHALAKADAPLLLFLGADILLRKQALAAHVRFHATHPVPHVAALGMVKWDPRLRPSPLMEWMTHGGGQNDFDSLLGKTTADPRHFFYGSHISIKRESIAEARFPTEYHRYGWEDLDFGRSLAPRLTVQVLHQAIGLHQHYYTPDDVWKRQRHVGRGLVIYQQRYPSATLLPRRSRFHFIKIQVATRTGAAALLRWAATKMATRRSTPHLFAAATTLTFWESVYQKRGYPQRKKSYPQ